MRAFVSALGDILLTSDPSAPVPAGALEAPMPADVGREALVWDGSALVDRASVATWYVDAHGTRRAFRGDPAWTVFQGGYADPDLATLKLQLKARIDARAEALRLSLITPGSGQAMEYQEAYAEAVQVDALLKAGQPVDRAAFPMLSASIGYGVDPKAGTATTDVAGEARAVLAAYDAYQRAGAAIRRARLAGKAAVDAATDAVTAQRAMAAIAWAAVA